MPNGWHDSIVPRLPDDALTPVRPTSQRGRLNAMTTPGDSTERPPDDQAETQFAQVPPPEPTPPADAPPPAPSADQAETQFAPIPPPDYTPPAYTPPAYTPPPASDMPPGGYPPPSYPPAPPSYPAYPQQQQPYPQQPQQPYPQQPQQPYPPQQGGYPAAQPYASGYPSAPYAGGYGAPQQKTNPMAIGSLVASVLGVPLFFACFTGILAAIAGIVLGIIALNQVKQSGEQGRGLALAGIWIGAVVLAFNVIFLIVAVAANSYSYM